MRWLLILIINACGPWVTIPVSLSITFIPLSNSVRDWNNLIDRFVSLTDSQIRSIVAGISNPCMWLIHSNTRKSASTHHGGQQNDISMADLR